MERLLTLAWVEGQDVEAGQRVEQVCRSWDTEFSLALVMRHLIEMRGNELYSSRGAELLVTVGDPQYPNRLDAMAVA